MNRKSCYDAEYGWPSGTVKNGGMAMPDDAPKKPVSDEVRRNTQCGRAFECLTDGNSPLCALDYRVKDSLFVKGDPPPCPYPVRFGDGYLCSCPTRRETDNSTRSQPFSIAPNTRSAQKRLAGLPNPTGASTAQPSSSIASNSFFKLATMSIHAFASPTDPASFTNLTAS